MFAGVNRARGNGRTVRGREDVYAKTAAKIGWAHMSGGLLLLFDLTETLAALVSRTPVFCLSFSPVDFRNFSS